MSEVPSLASIPLRALAHRPSNLEWIKTDELRFWAPLPGVSILQQMWVRVGTTVEQEWRDVPTVRPDS